MNARTPADDAGTRAVLNARADEVFMHAGITGDPATRADAERLRALASGDIHAARQALADTQLDEALEELHEARAEADRLRVALGKVTCTACDEVIVPNDEAVPDGDRWAHRDCMEAGE